MVEGKLPGETCPVHLHLVLALAQPSVLMLCVMTAVYTLWGAARMRSGRFLGRKQNGKAHAEKTGSRRVWHGAAHRTF